MSTPRIRYTPRTGATRDGVVTALANVYAFIIGCGEKEKAAGPVSRFVDQKEVSDVEHEASTAKNLT
jgi:hypothetical protein